ncbi:hypothetical protein HC752_21495 [Vibrio sp. S9_S30]|uniref:hypothetical protein n=1 Tax=Vibrio sp. S9_S30 TaxID=2720226 RepID=UPI0016802BDB|nr:hypothetical protein [Vibrio sp. S9_S30]MBD1559521.1 hypothetical protein [Vibrio sp. S9_S30]
MTIIDIKKPSLSKRWFGYRTECGLLARFALLVNYQCRDEGGVRAFIYATEEVVEGEACEVLAKINATLNSEFEKQLEQAPPPNDRGFFTQPWQGETRPTAYGELFYIPDWKKDNYIPDWQRSRLDKSGRAI